MTSQRWFIVTNTDNLNFFYNTNLIVDRQAFPAKSYMHDMQAERPLGYLPCFSTDNLSGALKSSKRQDENLISCLVEVDLKNIEFDQVYIHNQLKKDDEFDSIKWNEIDNQKVDEILLPAPLPLCYVKNIYLPDAKSLKSVSKEFIANFGDFPSKFFSANAVLFKVKTDRSREFTLMESPLAAESTLLANIEDVSLSYTKTFAYGGALALGYYSTKNGRHSSDLFEGFAENKLKNDTHTQLCSLVSWLFDGQDAKTELESFYSLIFDLIAGEPDLGAVHFDLLKLFDDEDRVPPNYVLVSRVAVRLRQLIDRTYEGDLDSYFSNLIKWSDKKGVGNSKVFLLISLVFIRDHSETLLKFYHDMFTEDDYFLSAVFFGLIKGVGNTPEKIRKITGLRDWISFKMAESMHHGMAMPAKFTKGPSSPVVIHKKFIKRSASSKMQDSLQKFSQYLDIDEKEFISWTLNTKAEYVVRPGVITFFQRPSLHAEIDHDRLENIMISKTIKETDELFDFNEVLKIFKA